MLTGCVRKKKYFQDYLKVSLQAALEEGGGSSIGGLRQGNDQMQRNLRAESSREL